MILGMGSGTARFVVLAMLAFIASSESDPMHAVETARVSQDGPERGPGANRPLSSSQKIAIGGVVVQVDFGQGALDLPASGVLPWVQRATKAVATYYGRFPVAKARVLILPVADDRGVLQGTTWGDMGGFSGFTRMRIGQHTTQSDLTEDWTMTHELVHMAFPDLPDNQHWMEEGLATYVEPIARVQAGELSAQQVWADMMQGMPKGEPRTGDRGMDHTGTWGRTYWGGAMFCLVADVEIRKQTNNRKGLQDALRAIVDAGGTIDKDWPLTRSLAIGDHATGTSVLTDLYKKWGDAPMPVDLDSLWQQLGVRLGQHGAEFDAAAPLARIREAITRPPAKPSGR